MAAPAVEALAGARRIHVVSHVDLDGLVAAALLARWARRRGVEVVHDVTGARGLYRMLRRALQLAAGRPGTVVVAADLAPRSLSEAEALAAALNPRTTLLWLDHHEWPSGAHESLEKAGAIIVHDRSKTTAEIACSLLSCWGDGYEKMIVEIARADDGCSDDPYGLADKWRLVLRHIGWDGLRRAAESLASGEAWPGWAREVYEREAPSYYQEIREKTSVERYSFEDVRVAVVTPPPRASGCDVQRFGPSLGPGDADVVVILYPRGMSIRTWGRLNANCIASKLGGGGHSHVAGAPRPSQSMSSAQIARMVARAALDCMEPSTAGQSVDAAGTSPGNPARI
ncbi:DHH family phosphoesterase [Hyperthermus butylicus]|uniref:DDH domain-containing protein n=1 Tax=Hyperthermus butylicus (strain DSM 5456 / JCM 9403 / PLM1-5) TaxID=415426 RepID=A2BKP0_HYPBU|nr:DHH family phosphoesterase [Hyperthermus butylicus]ABM80551.1 hypothetical protein Hbut_0696 [Hyperthermus butylicus DSM 5456]